MQAIISQAETFTRKGMSADDAAKVIVNALTSKRPRTRYTVGLDAAIFVRLARWISDRMLDGLVARDIKNYLPA